MVRKPLCILFALLLAITGCLTLVPHTAHASPENGIIVLFIPNTNWPPYLMDDPEYGEGVLVDVLREACKNLNYRVIPKRLPDKRGWLMLERGEVDAHAKAREWVQAADDFLWTDPFMPSEDVLLLRKDTPMRYERVSDLFGKRVATIKSFVYPALEPYFREKSIARVDTNNPYTMLDMVERGRVDAAMVNRSETLWLFKNRESHAAGKFRLSEKNVDVAHYRYVFTRQKLWKPFILQFNQELARMKKDGRLKAIMDKYR